LLFGKTETFPSDASYVLRRAVRRVNSHTVNRLRYRAPPRQLWRRSCSTPVWIPTSALTAIAERDDSDRALNVFERSRCALIMEALMGANSTQGVATAVFLLGFTFLGMAMRLDGNLLLVLLAIVTVGASIPLFLKAKAQEQQERR
jgi:hypothetical protein